MKKKRKKKNANPGPSKDAFLERLLHILVPISQGGMLPGSYKAFGITSASAVATAMSGDLAARGRKTANPPTPVERVDVSPQLGLPSEFLIKAEGFRDSTFWACCAGCPKPCIFPVFLGLAC